MTQLIQRSAMVGFLVLACQAGVRADFVVDFDDVTAPDLYESVTPGGAHGPTFARPGVTFSGGVVLRGSSFSGAVTSSPNLYATSDNLRLADESRLPGVIGGSLDVPVFGIGLDVYNALPNGNSMAAFTLTAFAADGSTLFIDTVRLFDLQLGRLQGASSTAIARFTVTTTQRPVGTNFSIDSVTFTTAAIPEPTGVFLLGLGVVGAGAACRLRRKAA